METARADGPMTRLTRSAAEVYEEVFVPALFGQWVGRVADAVEPTPGDRVLDVACGTGVLAREAARRVAPDGSVIGLDCNEGMLEVARRSAPEIDWRLGRAESLPFPDASFDGVACQFGLMFFEDQEAALREMLRVLRPGGRLAVAVWNSLDRSPGYAAMTALLDRLFGSEVGDELRAPFSLGEPAALAALCERSGLPQARIRSVEGTVRFESLDVWVHVDVKGWTLGSLLDDGQVDELVAEARRELSGFVQEDGTVAFDMGAQLVTAAKSASRADREIAS